MNGKDKGNMLISYLFKTADEIKNIDAEQKMRIDLIHLVAKWKDSGIIGRFVIADDEAINENLNILKQSCTVCKNHKANEPFEIRDDKGVLYKTSHISCCPYCGRYLKENYNLAEEIL